MTEYIAAAAAPDERSAVMRVIKAFECRRIAGDTSAAPAQIVAYPEGWKGRMPGHHIAAGEAQGAVERIG